MRNLGLTKNSKKKNGFNEKCAAQLLRALQRVGRCRKAKISEWAIHFKKLQTEDGVEKERIVEVLGWFIEYVRDKYTPKVFSARGFRDKFPRIEYAMSKGDDEFKDFRVRIIKDTKDVEIFEITYEN